MKPIFSQGLLPAFGLGLALLINAELRCGAVPYASCITNNGGTISYYLNENASDVSVIFNSGASTNDLGAQLKGLHTFILGANTNYSIQVSNSAPVGWVKTSDDSNALLLFNLGRGVTVNYHPQDTRLFGRIYIANGFASAAATNVNTHSSRSPSQGLFALNADQSDALGQGTTGKKPTGIAFNASSSNDPYKIAVGKDDNLVYVNTFSSADSTTWAVDGDLGAATQVLSGTGSNAVHFCYICSPVAMGSLGAGNMMLWNVEAEKAGHYGQIARWNIGNNGGLALPYATAPAFLGFSDHSPGTLGVADLVTDIEVGPDGKVFTSINRSGGTDTASVKVFDTDGTTALWNSLSVGGSPDPMRMCRAIQLSPDGTRLASVRDTGEFQIVLLTNGIPDLSTLVTITNNPNNPVTNLTWAAKDIALDAAGNVYTLGWTNNYGVRVYSPGGTTVATTGNDTTGTNGTFVVTNLLPTISVVASQPNASEDGTTGTFTISRTGDTVGPLTVYYRMSGTASNSADYLTLSGVTNIPAGAASVDVVLTPVADAIPEPTETAILTLSNSAAYFVGSGPATILISDTTTPVLAVTSLVPTMYERFADDYATVQITRPLGNTNEPLTIDVTNFTFGGSAVKDVDYVVLSNSFPISMDAGARVWNVSKLVSPLDNALYQGNRSIIVGMAAGAGFTASNATTTLTILDDENPPAAVLLADPLRDPDDANNWAITYGTGDEVNLATNYNVNFGYDLTSGGPGGIYGVIPLPPSGATNALRITCNKQANPGAAGGVNVYYTNQAFGGDYAVRFNMNVIQGGTPAVTTEGVMFGINHTGTQSNWWYGTGPLSGGPWGSDGVWYWISADPGGSGVGDFVEYTGLGGTNGNTGWTRLGAKTWPTFANVFKIPAVFTAPEGTNGGVPANGTPLLSYTATNWADVEIKQVRNVVTLTIDKTAVFAFTNNTIWTNGYLMLGYEDPYGGTGGGSVGGPDAAAYFSNLRVVRLTGPTITSIGLSAGNAVLTFATTDGNDTTSSFVLQSAVTVGGAYSDVSPAANFVQLSNGTFQVSVPQNGATRFYRLRHN